MADRRFFVRSSAHVLTSATNADFSNQLQQLIDELENAGCRFEAAAIRKIQKSAWTSSSEFLGELGKAIGPLETMNDLPLAARARVAAVMAMVRKTWPQIDAAISP